MNQKFIDNTFREVKGASKGQRKVFLHRRVGGKGHWKTFSCVYLVYIFICIYFIVYRVLCSTFTSSMWPNSRYIYFESIEWLHIPSYTWALNLLNKISTRNPSTQQWVHKHSRLVISLTQQQILISLSLNF